MVWGTVTVQVSDYGAGKEDGRPLNLEGEDARLATHTPSMGWAAGRTSLGFTLGLGHILCPSDRAQNEDSQGCYLPTDWFAATVTVSQSWKGPSKWEGAHYPSLPLKGNEGPVSIGILEVAHSGGGQADELS